MFWRIRLKLAALYTCAMAITLIAAGVAVFLFVRQRLDAQIDASISQASAQLLHQSSSTQPDPNFNHELEEGQLAQLISSDVFFVTTSASGQVLSNPRGIDLAGLPFARLSADAMTGTRWSTVSTDDDRYRFETIFVPAAGSSSARYIHIGQGINARDRELRTLAIILILSGGVAIVVSAAGGLWLAGRTLIPVRAAFDSQRRFISDASHELRTPLAVVRANVDRLVRRATRPLDDVIEQVDAIDQGSRHMTRLVNDLLTLARADEGRLNLATHPLSLDQLVADAVRDVDALAELHGVRTVMELTPVTVTGDLDRLRQVILILLDNAIRYSPAGATVTVRLARAGKRAVLSVTDEGPGITPEQQRHIFDRFYRADTARTGDQPDTGLGLGLAIAQTIVAAHHGAIDVQSQRGHGATFTVRLPAHQSVPAAESPTAANPP